MAALVKPAADILAQAPDPVIYAATNPGPVRRWAIDNGIQVAKIGRLSAGVHALYRAAHPDGAS